jgi:hypothetical protein
MLGTHKVHIAGRGSVVRQLRPDGYRDSHRNSVSFGQERTPISAPEFYLTIQIITAKI